jgi:hypothetical protein
MRYLHSVTSFLRKTILVGWAFAIVWIYVGNLVNFHQNRIWGKQLIPVACYSTRAKEKDGVSTVKNNNSFKNYLPGLHFDFSVPDQQASIIPFIEYFLTYSVLPDIPLLEQTFVSLSFRGPPAA